MNKELTEKLNKKYHVFFDWIDERESNSVHPMMFGFGLNDGWYWLLDNLMNSIYHYQKSNSQHKGNEKFIRVTQVKEKFGGLRFYYDGGNDVIHGMVSLVEHMSYNICENCGTTENVGRTKQGWIYVRCLDCHMKNDRAKDLEWFPNENQRLSKLTKLKKILNNNEDIS